MTCQGTGTLSISVTLKEANGYWRLKLNLEINAKALLQCYNHLQVHYIPIVKYLTLKKTEILHKPCTNFQLMFSQEVSNHRT